MTTTAGSTLKVGKSKYKLVQLHFHTPSEHTRYGKHRPMEVHFVHINDKKQLAVVGIFMRLGKKPNPLFAKILENAPQNVGKNVGKNVVKNSMVNGKGLHSRKMRTYFSYSGSLTTPPCSEQVRWFVMKNSVRVSATQITAFKKLFKHTNRPTQAMNGRIINKN
ncbi:Carbonic anhydrase, alpha class [hydrothermal vent metagenome]|uniref:carbonic anhydrase n=1 Tax=hydrothermal vent metagenome TaxID=652676 RepID=A0A3B0ZN76_9ZZZZ